MVHGPRRRKWFLDRADPHANSLEEAGDRLFAFARVPSGRWKSARTTNAVERLHEESERRIKTQTVLSSAETAAMLFWALLASGQITMRKVDGWRSLGRPLGANAIDLAAWADTVATPEASHRFPTAFATVPRDLVDRVYQALVVVHERQDGA